MKTNKSENDKYTFTQEIINAATSLAASIVTGNVGGMITSFTRHLH